MGNAGAQMSILDVHASNGDLHRVGEESHADADVEREAGGNGSSGGGLAAKAGIILVGHLCYPQISLAFLMHCGSIGHSQCLCRHTAVPSDGHVVHHLRGFGP